MSVVQSDPYGFDVLEGYLSSIRNWKPPAAEPPPDTRTNMERDYPPGYKPLTEEEMRAKSPLYSGDVSGLPGDYANARAEQIIQEREGNLLGTAPLTNPVLRGLTQAGSGLLQTAALPLHAFGVDASGAVLDEQRAADVAAQKLRGGAEEPTAHKWIKNVTAGVSDVLAIGGGLRRVGLAAKTAGRTYLALMGARSYDTSLKQADESGLKGADRHTFAAANAGAEVVAESVMMKLGKGVAGKLFPQARIGVQPSEGALRSTIRQTIGKTLLEAGKAAGEEGIEEGATQIAQNVNAIYHKLKPLSWDSILDGVVEAAGTGAAVGGLVGGHVGAGNLLAQRQHDQQRSGAMVAQQPIDLQGQLDANAAQAQQQQQNRVGVRNYADTFLKGRTPEQVAQLARLSDSAPALQTRTAFSKAAGIDRNVTPRRDIIGEILAKAAELHATVKARALPDWVASQQQTTQNPPAGGFVRMYHGGSDYEGGRRWLTPDRAYAEGYAEKSGGKVFYVDVPADSPLLVKSYDDSGTRMKAPYVSFEAPEELSKQLKPLENPPAGGSRIPEDAWARGGLKKQAQPGEAFDPQQGHVEAPWHADLSPMHRQIYSSAARDAGVEPARLMAAAAPELAAAEEGYQRKLKIRQEFGMSLKQRGILANSDEDVLQKLGRKGFDEQIDQFVNNNPEYRDSLEEIKDVLKERRKPEPPRLSEIVQRVAADLANHDAAERAQPATADEYHNKGEAYEGAATGFEGPQPADVPFRPILGMPAGVPSGQRLVGRKGQTTRSIAMGPGAPRPSTTGGQPHTGGINPRPVATMATTGKPAPQIEALAAAVHNVGEVMSGKKGSVRRGRLVGRKAAAQYNTHTGARRLKEAHDLTSLAHEEGHAISENTDIIKAAPRAARDELVKVGYALYGARPDVGRSFYEKEGYSEYLRQLLTSPADAAASAPEFHKYHAARLASNPAWQSAVSSAQQLGNKWFRESGAQERATSQLRNPHSFGEVWHKRIEAVKGLFTRQQLEDIASPLREFYGEVKRITGHAVTGAQNAFEKFKAYRSTFSGRINQFVEWGQFDRERPDQKTGKSLDEILQPVSDDPARGRKFDAYLFARSAEAYWLQGMDPGISEDDTQQILSELGHEQGFEQAADALQKWIESVNGYIGTFDPSYAEAFRKAGDAYTFYMPHKRILEAAKDYSQGRGGQAGAGGAKSARIGARRKGGGSLPVREQLAQLVDDKAAQLRRAMQRDVTMTLIHSVYDPDLSDGKPLAAFSHLVEEVQIPTTVVHKTDLKTILDAIEQQLGVKLAASEGPSLFGDVTNLEDLGDEDVRFFGKSDSPTGSDADQILVWKTADAGGRPRARWFVVHSDMQKILNGIEPAQLKGFLGTIAAGSTRLVKMGAIGFSPRFGLIRNVQRDLADMLVKMPGGKGLGSAGKALGQYFSIWARAFAGNAIGRKADTSWMNTVRAIGADGSHLFSEHIPTSSVLLHRLRTSTKAKWVDPSNWFDHFMELADKAAGAIGSSEMASRTVALRQRAEAMGWKPGEKLSVDQEIALALAYKESMGDYTAKGAAMRYVDLVIPFASTPITYGRSMGQALWKDGKPNLPAIAAGFSYLTVPTLSVWLWNKDEEWYKNLSPAEKYGRVLVKIPGENTGFMWNRSSEAGVIFSALFEALFDAAYRKDPEPIEDVARHIVALEMPDVLPPIAKEALRQAANREDITSGRPIVPSREGIDKRPTGQQYTEQTSETAKAIGKATGLSPLRIEHAADALTGGLTRRVVGTVESMSGIKPATREQQLSDTLVVGGLFPSGGLAGNRPKPIEHLHELAQAADEKQHDVDNPETAEEKARRLLLNAATRAVGAVMKERAQEKTARGREELMNKATHLAEEAASAEPGERAKFLGIAAGIEYRLEPDADKRSRMLYRRLDQLSDSKPKVGRGGVTKGNLDARRQAYTDHLNTARAFLEEAGVGDDEALKQFRNVVTRGLGDDKVGKIKSPEARVQRIRRLRQEIGGT